MSAGVFLKNRLIRIVPLYWFVTTIVFVAALIIPHVLNTTKIQSAHVIASYLFLPARHPVTGVFWPLLIPGWSLNYEMLFYIVFAIAISLSGRSRAVRVALIAGMLAAVLLVANLTKDRFDVMNFYANPVLLEFVAGVLLGIICRTGIIRSSPLWLLVVLAGFLLLWPGLQLNLGFPMTFAGATMIVAGAVFLPPLPHNPLSSLGDASYSLYLTHAITLSALALLWGHFFQPLGWQLFILAGLAAAFAIAFLMYGFFEAPMSALLKRVSLKPRIAAMIAPAPAAADTPQ
jgi:exopolysaccharide production protein ExoZ